MESGRLEDKKEIRRFIGSPIRSIFDKFAQSKDVSFIYGEPIEYADKKVLPVAKLKYSVGGGGGYTDNAEKESADGEGGGGFFSVNPVGVYEITATKVKFKPIVPVNLIFTLLAIFTFGLVWLKKKESARN